MMSFFKPKPGAIWNRNNVLHATEAMTVVAIGQKLGGKRGSTIALGVVVAGGVIWEALNGFGIPRGKHHNFDVKGLAAFVVPAAAAWLLNRITKKGKRS